MSAGCVACILAALNNSASIKRVSMPLDLLKRLGLKARGGMSALELGLVQAARNYDARGLWLEFGVYKGGSIKKIRNARSHLDNNLLSSSSSYSVRPSTTVFGFDSFIGLPETWRKAGLSTSNPSRIDRLFLRQGAFSMNGKAPFNASGVEWVVGLFNDTLPGFLSRHLSHAQFVHIDSDLYSSAKFVLMLLMVMKRFRSGTVIVFDELINYPEFMDGEIKALCELISLSGYKLGVLGTSASIVLPSASSIRERVKAQKQGRETPHYGLYRQDAAFVLR